MHHTRRRQRLIGAAALGVAVLLSGCAGQVTPPANTATTAPVTPEVPAELLPAGSAEENLPYFDQVNRATVAANPQARGRDLIDGLIAAGFDRAALQVSQDNTTLGKPVDAIEFSVHWNDQCLLGQFGPAVEGYNSSVQPALHSGGCLVGSTRPIDW